MREALTTLVLRVLDGDSSALFEFPLLFATTVERPLEWLLSIDFHVYLFEYLNGADDRICDAVLFILSELILIPSAEFLRAVLFTAFFFRGCRVCLAEFLEGILDTEDFERAESILYILSQIAIVFPERLDRFSEFVVRCLGWKETRTVAARISVFLVRSFPGSEFAAAVIPELPFDGEDPELSHHCFKAILAMLMCSPPNPTCFEVGDMVRFAFTPMARDALRVLIQATAVLFSKAEEVAEHVDELIRLFQEAPETRAHVSCIVSNCASVGAEVARRFLPFVETFCGPGIDDSPIPVKCEIARAIAATLFYSEVPLDEETWGETFEMLEGMLPMANAGMQSVIIDLLVRARWHSYGFREALEQLADVPNCAERIAELATLVLESDSYWHPS
jgi:hypothetical protein